MKPITKITFPGSTQPVPIPDSAENVSFSRKPDGSYQLDYETLEDKPSESAFIAGTVATKICTTIYLDANGSEVVRCITEEDAIKKLVLDTKEFEEKKAEALNQRSGKILLAGSDVMKKFKAAKQ